MIASIRSRVGLRAVGAAVPERVVTNDELAQRVDTSDEWIVTPSSAASCSRACTDPN